MKKITFFLLIFLISSFSIEAVKIASFQDNFKAPNVLIDNKNLYIWDQTFCNIRVYDRKNYKKTAEFGRRGNGPAEFIGIEKVSTSDDKVFVASFPKMCIFSSEGKLLKEIKSKQMDSGSFFPIGNNFIGQSCPPPKPNEIKLNIKFSLFNSILEKKKDIFIAQSGLFLKYGSKKEIIFRIRDCTRAMVSDDKLIIGVTGYGFYFSVFDKDGNRLYEIKKPYEKQKVSNEDKQAFMDRLKKSMKEAEWNQYKAMYEIEFPDYYPAYANFFAQHDRIYVFLYPKSNKQAVLILDMKGNLIKQKVLSQTIDNGCIEKGRFTVHNGKMYFLVENEDTDDWELHMEQID